jgi:hypothetical protein
LSIADWYVPAPLDLPCEDELGFSATIHSAAISTVATSRAISGFETLLIAGPFGRPGAHS